MQERENPAAAVRKGPVDQPPQRILCEGESPVFPSRCVQEGEHRSNNIDMLDGWPEGRGQDLEGNEGLDESVCNSVKGGWNVRSGGVLHGNGCGHEGHEDCCDGGAWSPEERRGQHVSTHRQPFSGPGLGFDRPESFGEDERTYAHQGPYGRMHTAHSDFACASFPREEGLGAEWSRQSGRQQREAASRPCGPGASAMPSGARIGDEMADTGAVHRCAHHPESGLGHMRGHAGGQAPWMDLVNDLAGGNADPSKLVACLGTLETQFWKGALVGVAVTLLVTNDTVRNSLKAALSGIFSASQPEVQEKAS